MSDNIELNLSIKSDSAKTAKADLNALKQASGEATQTVGNLATATDKMNQKMDAAAQSVTKFNQQVSASTSANSQAAQKMEEAGNKVVNIATKMKANVQGAQLEIREMANAVAVLNGPLGGIAGRMSAFSSLLGNMNPQMIALNLGLFAVGTALGFLTSHVVEASERMTVLMARVQNATMATNDFTGVWQRLLDISKSTGTSLETVVGTFARFRTTATDLGKSNDQMLTVEKTITELGVMAQLSESKLREVENALIRGFTTGILRGREFTSVLRNLPVLATVLAKELKTTPEGLIALAKAGKIDAKEAFDALLRAASSVDKLFANFPVTIIRAKQAMETEFGELAVKIDETFGISQTVVTSIQNLGGAYKFVKDNLDKVIVSAGILGASFIALNLEMMISQVFSLGGAILKLVDISLFTASIQETILSITAFEAAIVPAFIAAWEGVMLFRGGLLAGTVEMGRAAIASGVFSGAIKAVIGDLAALIMIERGALTTTELLAIGFQTAAAQTANAVRTVAVALNGLLITFAALIAEVLLNPWTYVIAGIVATGVALYNLKTSTEKSIEINVSWGDTIKGTWRAVGDVAQIEAKKSTDALNSMYDKLFAGNDWMMDFKTKFIDGFNKMGIAIQGWANSLGNALNLLPRFNQFQAGLAAIGKDAQGYIADEARQSLMNKVAGKIGVNAPDINNLTSMYDFYHTKQFQELYKNIHKPGQDIDKELQNYYDGSKTANTDTTAGTPTPPPKAKHHKETPAEKRARYTKEINQEALDALELFNVRAYNPDEQIYRDKLNQINAEREIRKKNIGFTPEKIKELANVKVQTKQLGADTDAVGTINDVKRMTEILDANTDAVEANRNTWIQHERQMKQDVAVKAMVKTGASEHQLENYKIALTDEQEAMNRNMARKANSKADADYENQKKLNEALAKGNLEYRQAEIEIKALNKARSDGSNLTDAELQASGLMDKLLKQEMDTKKAQFDHESNENDIELDQTNQLILAINKGTLAYQKQKDAIDAWNAARKNGNAITPAQQAALEKQIKTQQQANAQLQFGQRYAQINQQAMQGMGQAFDQAFNTAISGGTRMVDVMKQLSQALLRVATSAAEAMLKLQFDKGMKAFNNGGGLSGFWQAFKTFGGGSAIGGGGGATPLPPVALPNPVFANGGIFGPGGLHAFASGGIVNSPHIFPFANGTGLMGEAGPEAIMPLSRLPNGKLGVHAGGGGNQSPVVIHNEVHVTVNGGGTEDQNKDLANRTGKEVAAQVDMMVDSRIRSHLRPGGMLNQGTKT